MAESDSGPVVLRRYVSPADPGLSPAVKLSCFEWWDLNTEDVLLRQQVFFFSPAEAEHNKAQYNLPPRRTSGYFNEHLGKNVSALTASSAAIFQRKVIRAGALRPEPVDCYWLIKPGLSVLEKREGFSAVFCASLMKGRQSLLLPLIHAGLKWCYLWQWKDQGCLFLPVCPIYCWEKYIVLRRGAWGVGRFTDGPGVLIHSGPLSTPPVRWPASSLAHLYWFSPTVFSFPADFTRCERRLFCLCLFPSSILSVFRRFHVFPVCFLYLLSL